MKHNLPLLECVHENQYNYCLAIEGITSGKHSIKVLFCLEHRGQCTIDKKCIMCDD